MGFPGGASGKESACQCRRRKRLLQSLGKEDPLKEEMAPHSTILAWIIPWAEELGGQSMELKRVEKRSTGELKGAKTKTKISQPGWINWEFGINCYTLLHVK